MPILRSLARGLDTGMDSYVRQRLLNRERRDKQVRHQAEEDRYLRQEEALRDHRKQQADWTRTNARIKSLDGDLRAFDSLIEGQVSAGRDPRELIEARNRLWDQRESMLNPAQTGKPNGSSQRILGKPEEGPTYDKGFAQVAPGPTYDKNFTQVAPSPDASKSQFPTYDPPVDMPEAPLEMPELDEGVTSVPLELPTGHLDSSSLGALASTQRTSNIFDATRKLTSVAKLSPYAAEKQLRGQFPEITDEEVADAILQWEGIAGSSEWGQFDSETGMQFNKVLGRWMPAPGYPEGGVMTNQDFDRSATLRDHFRKGNAVKMFGAAQAGYEGAKTGYFAQDAPGDIALLYGFAKAVAPDDSAVREGEFATMESAQSWFAKILHKPISLTTGNRLDKDVRRTIWMQLNKIYRVRKESYFKRTQDYGKLSIDAGLKPAWVVPHIEEMEKGMWSRTTRELLEIVAEDPQAEAELRERFGVAENQSLVEVLSKFYYRKE